jgi:xanthine/CO dehydrogenase XdhC/CoxF family maturation factor
MSSETDSTDQASRLWAFVLLSLLVIGGAAAIMVSRTTPLSPVDVVERWTAARNAGDIVTALALLSEEAVVLDQHVDDPADLAALRNILEAQKIAGWRIEESGCGVDGERVSCRYAMDDELLRKCGLRFTGEHEYLVVDGKLDRQTRRHDPASRAEVYGALQLFRAWVQKTHPDDFGVIWVDPTSATYTTPDGAHAVMASLDEYPC